MAEHPHAGPARDLQGAGGGGGPSFRRLSRVTQRTCPTPPGRPNEAPELQPAPPNDHGCWLGALGTLPTAAECRPAKLAAWSWEASDLRTDHAYSSGGRSLAPRSNRGTRGYDPRRRAYAKHRAATRKKVKHWPPGPHISFFYKASHSAHNASPQTPSAAVPRPLRQLHRLQLRRLQLRTPPAATAASPS